MSHSNVEWMEFALCAQVDQELFHPTKGGPEIRPARTICNGCEVRLMCLNHAVKEQITEGIWGGFSGKQLRRIVRAGELLDAVPDYSDRRKFNSHPNARKKERVLT